MPTYERLVAWQLSHELALRIRSESLRWPLQDRFGLTFQIQKAALSAPTNIAEGAARRGSAEFRRFVDIALGSLAEVHYLLRFARDAGVLSQQRWAELVDLQCRAAGLCFRLAQALARKRKP